MADSAREIENLLHTYAERIDAGGRWCFDTRVMFIDRTAT